MSEIHILPLKEEGEGKYIIYRPLLGLAFVGNQAMANLALDLSAEDNQQDRQSDAEAIHFLREVGFFLPDPPVPDTSTALCSAALLVTNQCQLRCTYCYAAAGEAAPNVLDPETAIAVIDYACNQAILAGRDLFFLQYHGGGEPTLAWKTLTASLEYARSRPLPSNISITTNAIWSKEQCRWLIANMDSITISMDGARATQDKNRPLASGKPSSSIVLRSLKLLDEAGYPYGIRMTAAKPWSSLPENVSFILENTACRGIQVEPAFNSDRGHHESGEIADQRAFIEAFEEAYLIARGYKAEFHFPGARPGTVSNCFCTAPYQSLIVNPDHQIVACYEISTSTHPLSPYSVLGQVENNTILIRPGSRERLHDLISERQIECAGCFCRWSCAGDCYIRSLRISHDGQITFGGRCDMNRELTSFQILHLISESGGVWQSFRRKIPEEEFPNG